jgi:hypothetical protein
MCSYRPASNAFGYSMAFTGFGMASLQDSANGPNRTTAASVTRLILRVSWHLSLAGGCTSAQTSGRPLIPSNGVTRAELPAGRPVVRCPDALPRSAAATPPSQGSRNNLRTDVSHTARPRTDYSARIDEPRPEEQRRGDQQPVAQVVRERVAGQLDVPSLVPAQD